MMKNDDAIESIEHTAYAKIVIYSRHRTWRKYANSMWAVIRLS